MPNPYFKYKQFTVFQDKCGQKVCTDTSFFGAIINPKNPQSILDIGTGTGVLSLMVAQKCDGNITAVEIDEDAVNQAQENFKKSKWANRLSCRNGDIREYKKGAFDLIISNPPFFQNSQKSRNTNKRLARHNDTLSLKELALSVSNLLSEEGEFWVILPEVEMETLKEELLIKNIYPREIFYIKNYIEDTKISRVVINYTSKKSPIIEKFLAIYKDKQRDYSEEFVDLLKPYYLYL